LSRQLGGQAVIEGVMMRGQSWIATAVRGEDGQIVTDVRPLWKPPAYLSFLRWPVVRGATALVYSLIVGIQALSFSAGQFGGEEEKLTTKELVFTMLTALLFGVGLFILLPTALMRWLGKTNNTLLLSLGEGLLRLAIFLVYVVSITFIKDVKRIFEYHGAEHKVVHAYEEKGLPLTAADAAEFSPLHPRCGTSFLLYVMVVSILLFAFFGWPKLYLRVLSRLVLMPFVAGISYEWLRLAAQSNSLLVRLFSGPGLWLQRLTTREPDEAQIEVALVALREVAQREQEVIL
jgi:uncharacterized protein YqhQ